jgi:hypothetical protein
MDEHVGFLVEDLIYRFEKIIIHLLLASRSWDRGG